MKGSLLKAAVTHNSEICITFLLKNNESFFLDLNTSLKLLCRRTCCFEYNIATMALATILVLPYYHLCLVCLFRSSDTGEGHFYFTGRHAYRLFIEMKQMMSSHSKISSNCSSPLVASPLPSRGSRTSPNGFVRAKGEGGGSGSESDWTGTGDDWTGASSDSAFINYIRSRHQFGSTEHARFGPSNSDTPSPPPPHRSTSTDGIYTNLDPRTLNHDNQYCSIDRLQVHPVAGKAPSALRNPSPNRTPLNSMAELGESLNEEDEYCKMVPNAVIRSGLGPARPAQQVEETPPPVPFPTHRHGRSSFDSPRHTPSHLPPLPPLPGSGVNSPMHRQPLPQAAHSEML